MLITLLKSILRLSNFNKIIVLSMVDSVLCFLSLSISFSLLPIKEVSNLYFFYLSLISISTLFLCFFIFGFYKVIFRYSLNFIFDPLLKSLTLYLLIMYSFASLASINYFFLSDWLAHFFILLALIVFSRWIACKIIFNFSKDSSTPKIENSILIYGCGVAGRHLAINLKYIRNLKLIGFLDDNKNLEGRKQNNLKIYNPASLPELIKKYGKFDVVLAIPSIDKQQRTKILQKLLKYNLVVRTLPSIEDIVSGRSNVIDIKEVHIENLLSRRPIKPQQNLLARTILDKVVVVTGAGGSIGSELSRQIINQKPKTLILIDQNEFALFQIHEEITEILTKNINLKIDVVPVLSSILNKNSVNNTFLKYKPDTLFHAAAHKHVTLVEKNYFEGFINNVLGTLYLAENAINNKILNFVLISTDKAVEPKNMMGATKRISEMILQGLSQKNQNINFSIVRFGNVLGSSGSVVPIFKDQIKNGGPVKVRDERLTRFFMTISEAAELVIQASGLNKKFSIFYLDMGKPVKILDLAKKMILLSGYQIYNSTNKDGIKIIFDGLKPGEKLHEILTVGKKIKRTKHPRIIEAIEEGVSWDLLEEQLKKIEKKIYYYQIKDLKFFFKSIKLNYVPKDE